MEGILAVLLIFGGIPASLVLAMFLKQRHQQRLKELEAGQTGSAPGQVRALLAAKKELEGRVRNLESIVCNVDFELNAKLNRLASRQLALPPAGRTNSDAPSMSFAETEAFTAGTVAPGRRLNNRYVIERPLGQGGMGAVYLAMDEQLGEQIALKIIGGMAALDPRAADRLRREASAARRISHPNVVRLHDIGEADGLLFLSMEFVPGDSVSAMIRRHGVLPVEQVRSIMQQITEGLEAAHAAGVIHRDLKPGNLLMDQHGRLKIIDFGLARLPHLEGMTATNMIIGTVEYMAPEQIRGGSVDARTDIYALGAVMFHLLTGRPPFMGDTPIAMGFAHCTDMPVPPSVLRADLGPQWDPVVLRALAKDPGARFQTAGELRQGLP
jgi:serine/threonine-protein kinase